MPKKKLLLILVIFSVCILVLLSIFITKKFVFKDSPEDVLIKNSYILEREYKVAEANDDILISNYDFKKYSKNDISIYVFDYKEYEQAKESVLEVYQQEIDSKIDVYLCEAKNYVLKKRCDSLICDYQIAYDNYLISALEEVEYRSEIESLFQKIVIYKLKFE